MSVLGDRAQQLIDALRARRENRSIMAPEESLLSQRNLDEAAVSSMFVPGLGDALGVAAGVGAMARDPSWLNAGMLAAELFPGPALGRAMQARRAAAANPKVKRSIFSKVDVDTDAAKRDAEDYRLRAKAAKEYVDMNRDQLEDMIHRELLDPGSTEIADFTLDEFENFRNMLYMGGLRQTRKPQQSRGMDPASLMGDVQKELEHDLVNRGGDVAGSLATARARVRAKRGLDNDLPLADPDLMDEIYERSRKRSDEFGLPTIESDPVAAILQGVQAAFNNPGIQMRGQMEHEKSLEERLREVRERAALYGMD